VNYGDNQAFTISADTGYHILDVLVDEGSVGALSYYNFTNVQANHTISATFTINQYTLTINTVGSGSVALSPLGGVYDYGTSVTLNATADPSWSFTGWSDDLTGSTNPESITMDGDKTVTATFNKNRYNIIITLTETGGKIDTVIFGERPDASDGMDSYDTPKPPAPNPPYIRAFFNTTFPVPHHELYEEYKHYPGDSKIWYFKVKYDNTSGVGTTITITWNKTKVDESEYDSVNLMRKGPLNSTWYITADMLNQNSFSYVQESYEFPPGSGTIYWILTDVFKIICS
jgi:uncharacterized repeat protein (TIGR02543 family)